MAFISSSPCATVFKKGQFIVSQNNKRTATNVTKNEFAKRKAFVMMAKPKTKSVEDNYVYDENKPLLMSDLDEGLEQRPGFTDFSELMNGRAAMIGFIALLAIELFTGRGFLSIISDFTGGS